MSSDNSSAGDNFLGLLAIVFITLKLTGHIDWSWWWVLAPLWVVPVAIIVIILGIIVGAIILGAGMVLLEWWENRR